MISYTSKKLTGYEYVTLANLVISERYMLNLDFNRGIEFILLLFYMDLFDQFKVTGDSGITSNFTSVKASQTSS
jgi:hypothetical protein